MTTLDNGITAFVTGGTRGIGLQIARHIAPFCSRLAIAAKSEEHVPAAERQLKELTNGEVHSVFGDLAQGRLTAQAFAQELNSHFARLDVLVLNAGFYIEGALMEISDEDLHANYAVNFTSTHYLVTELLPLLRKSARARIVIIGSTAAYEPYPLVPTYGVAKWALRGYAVNLRRELMKDRIGVTFLSSGATLTDMWAGVELEERRLLDASDIGKLVAAIVTLSEQAVVDELIVRPMLGDMHE